jgi:flagellar basal-body rod protein FlgB
LRSSSDGIAGLDSAEPEVRVDNVTPARADGNNVSIDKEMSGMVKNTIEYEALIQLMNLKGSMLRTAITEGRR